jgi:hypothetical protein
VVSIYSNPTITAVPQRTLICKGEKTNLLGSGAVTYVWSTTQTGSAVAVNPTSNTTYTVEGTDQNGCKGTAVTQLKVSTCAGISEKNDARGLQIHVFPNPNNGSFTIISTGDLKLNLVNELGQVVRLMELSANNGHQQIITDLARGIYFLSMDGVPVSEKIVVTD